MKGITGYLFIAAGLALAGTVCLGAGLLDRDMAHAQQSVAALKYNEADQTFATAERYFEYSSRLPWIGNGDCAWNGLIRRRTAHFGNTTRSNRRIAWSRGQWNVPGKKLC